jgi:hypothetical protein
MKVKELRPGKRECSQGLTDFRAAHNRNRMFLPASSMLNVQNRIEKEAKRISFVLFQQNSLQNDYEDYDAGLQATNYSYKVINVSLLFTVCYK